MKSPEILKLDYCFGCGVCARSCPQKIIDMRLDKDGFYRPVITDAHKCTGCKQCDSVCAFINVDDEVNAPLESFAVWSKDGTTREKSSSGGVSIEVARHLINQGYEFCGVKYDLTRDRAEHYIASTIGEAEESVGSKYIQSFTVDGFNRIDLKRKYLVSGTPCQIASFRRYIKKLKKEDNFILMDFFCHSVPSILAWKYYIGSVKKQLGKIESVAWRNKASGWHNPYCITINGDLNNCNGNIYSSNFSNGDIFYQLFFGDYCSNEACAKACRFKKNNSAADIRLGDLWGPTYKDDNRGVSAVAVFTERGRAVIDALSSCEKIPHQADVVTEGQMASNIHHASVRGLMLRYLRTKNPNTSVIKSMIFAQRALNKMRRILKSF